MKISTDEIRKMTEAAAGKRVLAAKSPSEIEVVSVIELSVEDVQAYEHNPRQQENEKYEDIKDSIRARGLESALYITKRPGGDKYVLARGGKTRLRALQELAQEDAKFAKISFHEVPWVSESEIMAAHLVENTSRSEMCFWDVAEGIQKLLAQISKESGKSVSSRDVPKLLKTRGINIGRTVILAAEFALKYLQNLGPWKRNLSLDHVHTVIRANFVAMLEIMELDPRLTERRRKEILDEAITECVATQASYSPQGILDSVAEAAAKALGVTKSGLMYAVKAHQEQALTSLPQLLELASHRAESPLTTEVPPPTGSSPTGPVPEQPQQDLLGGRADTMPEAARKRLIELMGSATNRKTDVPGIPGISVAKGLTPRPVKGNTAKNDGIHGGPLTQQELELLDAQGPKGIAKLSLMSALTELGNVVGISDLIVESSSPHLPYGYYVELPEKGAISNDAVALDAWWLLAALSGQGEGHLLPKLIGPDAADGIAFRSIEPGTFGHAVIDQAAFNDAMVTRLGGREIPAFDLLLRLITRRDHPLYAVSLDLIDACAGYNAHHRQGGAV